MKDFNKKIARFVELSKEFTINENEVYDNFSPQVFSIGNWGLTSMNSSSKLSKNIQYEIYLEQKLNKTRRYEEYKILQADLSRYFEALEKMASEDENVEGRV